MPSLELPAELWEVVLENVDSSFDVLHAMQSCHLLYSAGIRSLYEHIKWQHPQRSAHNLEAWHSLEIRSRDLPSSWFMLPSSLTIAHHHDPLAPRVNDSHLNDPRHEDLQPSADAPCAISRRLMGHCISNFHRLTYIHFAHSTIPESVYQALFSLPCLRHLRVEHSILPSVSLSSLHLFASLPIESLVLKDVSWSPTTANPLDSLPPLFLSVAAKLATVEVEWSPDSAAFFARHSPYNIHPFALPSDLRNFKLLMPIAEAWLDDPDDMYLALIAPLIQFLEATTTITHLGVVGQLPNFFLPTSVLPNLKSYCGPINLFNKLPRRDLNHLEFTDKLSIDQHALLERLPSACPNLNSLSFICDSLDDIVHTMVDHLKLPRLTDLAIISWRCGSFEDASQILTHFPNIHTLRFYEDATHPCFHPGTPCPHGDPPGVRLSSDRDKQERRLTRLDDDVEVSLKSLTRCYTALKEVQLQRDVLWRRCVGEDWARILVSSS